MKYLYPVLFLLVLSSCHRNKFTDINGTVTGFNSGTVIIKDGDNNKVATANIEDGKFHIRQILAYAGFYRMRIIDIGPVDHQRLGYDLYLEPGDYTITAVPEEAHQYPLIKSSSATQTELSDFYTIANPKTQSMGLQMQKIEELEDSVKLSHDEIITESGKLDVAKNSFTKAMADALQLYVNKYPQNHVAAHLMYQMDYANDPTTYNNIYQKFSNEQKKTNEGAEEGDKLSTLINLAPGNTAPQLTGKTIDGKIFDPKTLHKKVILVEFWRSDDNLSREQHKYLMNDLGSPLQSKNFAMISFSLDTDKNTWVNAVKKDKMTWIQMSDLKGQKSPNISNWQIIKVPTYYLLDSHWKIIKTDVSIKDIPIEVAKYL